MQPVQPADMPKPPYLQIDNLDDRREIVTSLERLGPADRLAWLKLCCNRVAGPHGDRIRVARKSTGSAIEVALDFWNLVSQYDLDPVPAAVMLERLVRRRGTGRRLWAASGGGSRLHDQ